MKILLAHGGRPLVDGYRVLPGAPAPECLSRHQRHSAEESAEYFPRLEEIAHKTLFGTDWPGPGVPGHSEEPGRIFARLDLPKHVQDQILSKTALESGPR